MHVPTCSPDVLLASFLFHEGKEQPRLVILTGPSGAGKTTMCQQLVSQASEERRSVVGLLSPPVFEDGEKVGIELLDLAGGKYILQASRIDGAIRHGIEGPSTGAWLFNQEALVWGNRILSGLLVNGLNELDLLILDELGPLELEQGLGLQMALPLLDAWIREGKPGGLACVVVRPKLIPLVLVRWPACQVYKLGAKGKDDPR